MGDCETEIETAALRGNDTRMKSSFSQTRWRPRDQSPSCAKQPSGSLLVVAPPLLLAYEVLFAIASLDSVSRVKRLCSLDFLVTECDCYATAPELAQNARVRECNLSLRAGVFDEQCATDE
jgi:hypothetical protein